MNNPSPLVPQGSMLEQKNKSRARVRLAVFFVLSIHVVGLMALLMQGCRREEPAAVPENTTADTSAPVTPAFQDTNPLVAPTDTVAAVSNTYVAPTEMAAPAIVPSGVQEYTVVSGDTLSSIAKNFHVTVKALQEANPTVQPTRLQIGQKLQIPPPAPAAVTPSATAPTAPEVTGGAQIYTVKSGDNLTKIAAQFHTTVKAIRSANSLTTDRIQVGQKLTIPQTSPAPMTAPATTPGITNP